MTISVRPISSSEHLAFINSQASASFLQTPAWAKVKSEWRSESLGFFDGTRLRGVALVLYRQLPKIKRYLAYVPEGPVLDEWSAETIAEFLEPFRDHVHRKGAFALRIGPPVVVRRWYPETIKAGIADPKATRLRDLQPDEFVPEAVRLGAKLARLGWLPPKAGDGFAAGQPQYVFQLPLDGKDEAATLKGMNQLWRRNIKRADKEGVEVTLGTRDDLDAFHTLYLETAERDRFTPRPVEYFRVMWDAMAAEDPDRLRLYLAHHEGDLVAATTWVRVGEHAWYSYGASPTHKREVRGSNAIQWRMIRDAMEAGATVYDLRGITDGIGADDPEIGLIQFKVGTGGQAVELLGEWDLPLNRVLYKAFDWYLSRRG
ncbi:lipid II:glycine glycyltransferase FemX [Enemella sp. A6]|uniref:lipid II:glycine glycyltransferase FemX n=1 Tax=Enemella sp. A6 TaxID=3440152 RepID=UPI003EBBAC4E